MMRCKRMDERLSLFKTRNFPASFASSHLPFRAVIGIGGNVGDVMRRFEHLLVTLKRAAGVDVVRSSAILKNPPFGYLQQPFFYNAVLEIRTRFEPHRLLRLLQQTEKRFGRRRSFANAPRTLDLDIIFFDGRTISTKRLSVPHPHWQERQSVVIPMSTLHVRGI